MSGIFLCSVLPGRSIAASLGCDLAIFDAKCQFSYLTIIPFHRNLQLSVFYRGVTEYKLLADLKMNCCLHPCILLN